MRRWIPAALGFLLIPVAVLAQSSVLPWVDFPNSGPGNPLTAAQLTQGFQYKLDLGGYAANIVIGTASAGNLGALSMPSCSSSSSALTWTTSSGFGCNTISGGTSAFSALTGGTNTTAAMVVGSGAALSATGSGSITATAIPVGGVTGLGTGVASALGTNVSGTGAICLASGSACAGGGSGSFTGLSSGTNTTAAMVVGSGATLGATGSGTITATAMPVADLTGAGTGVLTALAANVSGSGAICLASGSACGSGAFNALTSGTNTTAAMVVGSGATLNYTGSGVINANEYGGIVLGTLTNGDVCTYSSTGPTIACNTSISGGGNVSTSGSITTNGMGYWASATTIASTAAPTNGQLLIGSTGAAPVLAALTAGSPNVVITNGSGSISIATTAPINAQSGTTYTVLSTDNGKVVTLSNTSAVAVTLPQAGTTGFGAGYSTCFVNNNTGLVTITTTTSTINGNGQTLLLPQGASGCLASDGTNYSGTLNPIKIPGTSGGVPYYASANEILSSGVLTANLPVLGGGAGAAPTVGTVSGNTTEFATASGSLTANDCVKIDASGNFVDNGTTCGGASGTITIGSTVVSGGTSGNCLTISSGTVGNASCGSGGASTLVAPEGRLTLVTHTPVMNIDEAAKSTIYYDCYRGNVVPYYTGSADALDTIASCEVSLTMPTSGTGVTNIAGVFDIWWVHGGTNRICVATNGSGGGWASDSSGSNSTRGIGYSQVHNTRGYWTNVNSIADCYNGSTNYGSVSADQGTYLGTIYTTAAGQTTVNFSPTAAVGGTANVVGLWNAYNRVPVVSAVNDSNTSYSYTTASWREADSSGSNSIIWVDGLQQTSVSAISEWGQTGSGIQGTATAINVDSTTASGNCAANFFSPNNASVILTVTAECISTPLLGAHYMQEMELGATGGAFYASSGIGGSGVLRYRAEM